MLQSSFWINFLGQWVLIQYHSKKLQQAVQNHGSTDLELTGLVYNILGFSQFLKHHYIEVLLDHKTIENIYKRKERTDYKLNGNIIAKVTWLPFWFEILGRQENVSDALSRLHIEAD